MRPAHAVAKRVWGRPGSLRLLGPGVLLLSSLTRTLGWSGRRLRDHDQEERGQETKPGASPGVCE